MCLKPHGIKLRTVLKYLGLCTLVGNSSSKQWFSLSHCAPWKLGNGRKAFDRLKLCLDLTSSSQNSLLVGKSEHFKWNHADTKWCLYCRGLLIKPELQKHALNWFYMKRLSLHCGIFTLFTVLEAPRIMAVFIILIVFRFQFPLVCYLLCLSQQVRI